MHQGIQGKEVTFKDVLILFFKRFERIFIVALAFAVVFAAYGAMRGYRAISSENRQKQLDDYQIKLDEYNDSTQKLRDTIDDSQKQLDDLVQYTEDSIYYNLDPYNEAVSELVFYVDTGYQIAPSQYYQNPNKTGEIVSAYCDAYRSAGLYEEVSSLLGEDVDVKYIDELLTIERAGDTQIKDSVGNVTVKHSDGNAGVVVIRARAQDEQTASNITSYVFNYLKENLGNVIAEHTTTVLSDSTMVVVDEELENLHKETREEMAELEETIKTNQAELATLERDMPVEPTFSMMSVVKKAILFGIIGGILGGISDGSPIIVRAHIKPTPSVFSPQETVNKNGENILVRIKGRHDPVIVPRAVVVVEAMTALTLVDLLFAGMPSRMEGLRRFYGCPSEQD